MASGGGLTSGTGDVPGRDIMSAVSSRLLFMSMMYILLSNSPCRSSTWAETPCKSICQIRFAEGAAGRWEASDGLP